MQTVADRIIDALGGTTAVSRMIDAPLSTVHSWRKNGIPRSRLSHLRLVAREEGKADKIDAIISGSDHDGADTIGAGAPSCGNADKISARPVEATAI